MPRRAHRAKESLDFLRADLAAEGLIGRERHDPANRAARRRLDRVRGKGGVVVLADAHRRGVRNPDAGRRKPRPCRIKAHIRRRAIRNRDRFSFLIVDGDDPAQRLQVLNHGRSSRGHIFRGKPEMLSAFGSTSNVAPIMTNAMRLPPLTLAQPCQLPSCTTASPALQHDVAAVKQQRPLTFQQDAVIDRGRFVHRRAE